MIWSAPTHARSAAGGAYALDMEASLALGILLSAIHAARHTSKRAASSSRFVSPSFCSIAAFREKLVVIGSSRFTQSRAYSNAARPMPTAIAATEGLEE